MPSTRETVIAIRGALSAPRLGTYELASGRRGDDDPTALALYAWNAQVSAALLAPLHICEVVVRNAVADALEAIYGDRWPWSPGFEQSLPAPQVGYSPRQDLQSARRKATTVGKVIPELKFVFWQKMFTQRNDDRLWRRHLRRVFPNLDSTRTIEQLRESLYGDLEHIRTLRNRIAHHEPIFSRNLGGDLCVIRTLIEHRCKVTADWAMKNQQASELIAAWT
ncbi:hypothetical protein CSQ89_13825 [Chitinimonas sp. BJB300]|nr:hypothetical protein CSQ89_13825 [Chitinimonas sp. BJB300]TSJ88194.1 hypothetical protein FG002_011830 [Chitinimonas sp. BJB300]